MIRMERISWVVEEIMDLMDQHKDLTYSDVRAFNTAGWHIIRIYSNDQVIDEVIYLVQSDLWEAWQIAQRLQGGKQ